MPLCSLSFDDCLATHYNVAAPLLESHGIRGTFFVYTGVIARNDNYMNVDDIVSLEQRGHEIGNHTHSHFDLDKIDWQAGWNDIQRAQKFFIEIGVKRIRSFAYPANSGYTNVSLRHALNRLFNVARISSPYAEVLDFNLPDSDAMQVASRRLYNETATCASYERLIDNTHFPKNAWLSIHTHGVSENPLERDLGCCPNELDKLIVLLKANGFEFKTMGDAAELFLAQQRFEMRLNNATF